MIVGAGYEVRPAPERDWRDCWYFAILDPYGRHLWTIIVNPIAYDTGAVAEIVEPGKSLGIFVERNGTRCHYSLPLSCPPGEFGPILDLCREAGVVFPGEEE